MFERLAVASAERLLRLILAKFVDSGQVEEPTRMVHEDAWATKSVIEQNCACIVFTNLVT